MFALQYISSGSTPEEHLNRIENCCKAGVKWVQLRLKSVPVPVVLDTAQRAKKICDAYGAFLLINDFVGVAREVRASGVHLGQADMDIITARKILGSQVIIGGTANDIEQVEGLILKEVNYIGLGPFRFTHTKKNLSPVLGLSGYQKIFKQLKDKNHQIPSILAVGGIKFADIIPLKKTGISGIAVSSLFDEVREELVVKIKNNFPQTL